MLCIIFFFVSFIYLVIFYFTSFYLTWSIWFNLFFQAISRISWTLGEKVISNCAIKLKPFLMKAVEFSGRALSEYAQIVIDICQKKSESPQYDVSYLLHFSTSFLIIKFFQNKYNFTTCICN